MIISTGVNARVLSGRSRHVPMISLPFNRVQIVREDDGTVTINALSPAWTPVLTREPDGTVTISE